MTKVVHCKKEPYDVYCGRPGPYGNPFTIPIDGSREEVIAKYRRMITHEDNAWLLDKMKKELKDKIIACWCKPQACHCDVIAELIDGD